MNRDPVRLPKLRRWGVAACATLLMAGCGGGGGSYEDECSVPAQKSWLGSYMNDWYFWYRLSPRPNPASYASVADYFWALLYTGTDPDFPADRWSGYQPTESFNRFYGDGATLGYGVSVNGLEAVTTPGTPLFVRYVEPASPAAAQGVRRGDQVISINGRSAADIVAADDFSALTADQAGQQLRLVLRNGGVDRSITVVAAVFNLTPVAGAAVYTSQGGRRLGYVMVKDMISQAGTGLDTAFATFRAQGVQEVVIDLRYNGGGLVSAGGWVASYVAGSRGLGRTYASLLYNDKRASGNNQTFGFSNFSNALGLARAFVLVGPRTCSASEQVINGLRGVGVQVIAVGDTTCGKPVGSLPQSWCGTTYSAVNFESVNALNQGRYFDGFDATCPVAEDYAVPQGAGADPLVATAAFYADTGLCAPPGAAREQPLAQRAKRRPGWLSDERSEMLAR